jgi:hypothetical protein
MCEEVQSAIEDIPGVLNVTWLSNEAYFQLVGCINKQNVRFLILENPRLIIANLQ